MSDLNLFDMSDEDIAKMSEPTMAKSAETETKAEETNTNTETDGGNNEDQSKVNEDQNNDSGENTDQNTETEKAKENTTEADSKVKESEVNKDEVKDDKTETKPEDKKEESTQTAEAQLSALFAPIKANGRETKIESIEEARQLISMGLGFNKKMGQAKRALKLEMMLNNNKIDEDRLNFLIDVSNKNPEAISKLVQESGIDALELDVEKAGKYQRSNHVVSDNEVVLNEVLNELDSSPTVTKTLNVVAQVWDDASRKIVHQRPQLLKVIDEHMSSGAYDLIVAQLDKERALGKHTGLSDIQAYQQVGDAMNEAGKFAHLYGGSSTKSQQTETAAPVVVQPKLKQAEDDEQRNKLRKAAGAKTPTVSSAKPVQPTNLLDMPDEEFAKFNLK